MNPCYRGFWSYGVAETKWSSDKDYAQRVTRSEPLKSGQYEGLRIVSDETWYAAQKRLAEEVAKSGRKPKDGRKSLPNLLRALFFAQSTAGSWSSAAPTPAFCIARSAGPSRPGCGRCLRT